MRYYYPYAPDALSVKKQFFKEHHYGTKHCFKNDSGTGYVLFGFKEDVNLWYKDHMGRYSYTSEYEPRTIYRK